MKFDKRILLLILPIIILITLPTVALIVGKVEIKSIDISEELNIDNTKTITIKIKNTFNREVECALENNDEKEKLDWIKAKNNKCKFDVEAGNYNIYIKDEIGKTKTTKLDKIEINEILDLKISKEKIYLPLDSTYKIETEIISLGEVDTTLNYISEDENVATMSEGIITSHNAGRTNISVVTSNKITKNIEVIVTDLIGKPSQDNNKQKLTCNRYTKEENDLIDEYLSFRINEAGYQTRGAVVEASRFLVLEFPYRIEYFFENGRLNNYGGKNYVDGEGRYYKKGLYLNDSRFESILASKSGPVIWGCPLMNWQTESGYVSGQKYANGLDCSGFVSWALLNAGFDVGDSGAGDTYRTDDIGDLGIKHALTKDFVNSGNYKVGDLIGRDGHIALIAGLDDENIYIAESLVGGVVIKPFSKNGSQLYKLYEFINTMDEIYKEEGNYTNMW